MKTAKKINQAIKEKYWFHLITCPMCWSVLIQKDNKARCFCNARRDEENIYECPDLFDEYDNENTYHDMLQDQLYDEYQIGVL